MTYEERKHFLVNFFYYAICIRVFFIAVKFGWEYLTPFVISFIVAFFLKPIVNKVNVYLKIKRPVAAVLVVLIFYAVTVALFSFIGIEIFVLIQNIIALIPRFYEAELAPAVEKLFENIQEIAINIDPTIKRAVEEYSLTALRKIGELVSAGSMAAVSWISSALAKIPSLFVGTLITIISSVFMSVDYYEVTYFIAKQLNIRQITLLYETENYAKTAIGKYLKSYLLIMFITFMEVGFGLWVLGVKMPFVISRIIAVLDIMPVLGTGGVLVPWAVISVTTGDVMFGVGMFILYLIVTVIRNIIEPKIIGQQVGLHPVVTLLALFLGAKLRGIVGLFGLPVTLVIVKQLNDSGKIKLFK